jgi:uroporphyrinogen decarboxylase
MTALAHAESDRVPIFAPNVMDTKAPYDEGIQQFLQGFPFDRLVYLESMSGGPHEKRQLSGDMLVDGYGCRYQYRGVGLPYCTYSPLASAETVADIEAFGWPDPDAFGQVDAGVRDRARALHDRGEYATALGLPPLYHQYHYLRGFEQWMVDIKLNRPVHEAISSHIQHIQMTLLMRSLDQVGEYVDFVTAGDDFGWSSAPYMSPQDFRRLIKPYYEETIRQIKGRYPHVKFYLHSHGQIMDLVPDLIECGVDVLNPVLPMDNMDPVRLKRDFGDDLCFHGGIDVEHVLPFGTVDEVRDHVKRVIDLLGSGGGYWFKAQVISPVIPPENVIAAHEAAVEYGAYET